MAYVKVAMEAQTDIDLIGTYASLPATGVPIGSTYYAYDTGETYITYDGTNWVNFTKPGEPVIKVSLVDEATYSLPDESSGFAVAKLGGSNNYRAVFHWDEDGAVVMLDSGGPAYVKDTDTDGYLCIYTSTKQVIIKNHTGSDGTLKLLRMV